VRSQMGREGKQAVETNDKSEPHAKALSRCRNGAIPNRFRVDRLQSRFGPVVSYPYDREREMDRARSSMGSRVAAGWAISIWISSLIESTTIG
jgi:hypothetical protein